MEVLDQLNLENPKSRISKSQRLLKIHKKTYQGEVNGSRLLDHCMSLKHGLTFLGTFLEVSTNKILKKRIRYFLSHVMNKLDLLRYLKKDENRVMNLEHAYVDLREEMKNVIINPETNEYDEIFSEIFIRGYVFSETSVFLCEKIKILVTSDCKADQITPMMKELEDIRNMLTYLLEPFFEYAHMQFTENEEEKMVFTTVTSMLDRAICFIYLSFLGKMDDGMVLYLKNSLSGLIIEETQIMKMYLILDIDSTENLKSHISMSLRLLKWNKKCFLGKVMGATLEDHFMSIKHGLQFLVRILEISKDIDLKLRIQHLVVIVKEKLYSLPLNQKDENLVVNLDHAYDELREEMQAVVIKPGTNDYHMLFPEILKEECCFGRTKDFLLEKIRKLVTSRCKAGKITPMMKELEELKKKLTSLRPLFDYVDLMVPLISYVEEEGKTILGALATFVDGATCLIYLSFIGKLNEDMLVSMRKKIFFLITGTKEMSRVLEVKCKDNIESDIDQSLSLLKRHEEYHMGTINEIMLKDHVLSVTHGIEFLKWLHEIYNDSDLEQRITLLAGNVKQKLELLTYELGDESVNMDVNYSDLREEMKNVIINPATDKYYTLFQKDFTVNAYFRSNNDFLLEKITTLLTSNCKADQIAPLKKELQDLRKILACLKPLGIYVVRELSLRNGDNIFTTLFSIHHKAILLIYLAFVGKMDMEMVLAVNRNLSTSIKETDVWDMYTMIFNEVLCDSDYLEEELYLLENLLLLLKSNAESLNDANSKLYEVLIDIHIFLLGLSRNVLLTKLHLLLPSFQAIFDHSIPIICACYLEHTEVDISAELNSVLDLIKHIKCESLEIKLYFFPKTDDLGFLELFCGYLDDLIKNQELSTKEEIGVLHFEVLSLFTLAKVRNQEELKETPWADIIGVAYQAEYIIDLYLVSSSTDLVLISSLSKIIEQLKNIREVVHGLRRKSLPAQDVAVTSKPQVLGTNRQVPNNDTIMGFQEEAGIITEYLLKGENKLDVISIVGMGGVGKTTLALTLYKTPSVVEYFDILAWCTVSQSYQNKYLLFAILDQVNASDKNHRGMKDDQELADHLCRCLKKRRYLIVLDGIWDTDLWDYMRRYLPDDRNGSRILITTRNKDVADQIGSKVNKLDGLSEESSWELFLKKLLGKGSLSGNLLEISKGIVKNCKGLPLSIVIIAGVLSGIERTEENWNQIAESVNSFVLSDSQGECKAILELSFDNLPNILRSCFLYLGSFEEGQEISVNRLINLWIGDGLVRDTKSHSAEEVAKKYVDDLIVKSLVIPSKERSRGGVKTFRFHDLLRGFCLDKAKEKHFFMLLDRKNYCRPLQDPRRLIINGVHYNGLHFSYHSIRSIICNIGLKASDIEKAIQSYGMVLIKVLDAGRGQQFFPDISSLVHLRYLALSFEKSFFPVLPSSISKLQNLQFLILRCGHDLIEVPDFIWDMVKLRHVAISPKASFLIDSNRFQTTSFLLENLRSLSKARVSCGDSKWLRKLSGLQRVSCVFVDDDLDADAELGVDSEEDDDLDVDDEEVNDLKDKQFRMLSFNAHLISLKVDNAASSKKRFISTCQLPTSLQKLTLSRFFLRSNDISKIGRTLPHLEVLKIHSCHVPSGYQWEVDDEVFPHLKVLKLRYLKISKWISTENIFPNLEQLWVEQCTYLDEIPLDFGYLLKLRLMFVRDCTPSVDDSARQIEKLQHEEQNTEMKVLIYPRSNSHMHD